MLDRLETAYSVKQLETDVSFQLQEESFILKPGSALSLTDVQAEEGLPSKAAVRKVMVHLLFNATLLSTYALVAGPVRSNRH